MTRTVALDAVVEIARAVKDGTLTLEEADAAVEHLAEDDGQPDTVAGVFDDLLGAA